MYDGSRDVQRFHKFMTEVTEYVRGYELEQKRHAITVSHFLFNYCFPIDFRMKMRAKFNRCKQSDRTVRDFAHECFKLG